MKFQSSAERDLERLDRTLRRAILQGCHDVFDDWTIGKRLKGRLIGFRSHRIGDYRILYQVKESSSVEIVGIGHREEIYERMNSR